jgi:hypothetical protein
MERMNETLLNGLVLLSVIIAGGLVIYFKFRGDNFKDEILFLESRIENILYSRDKYHDLYVKELEENTRLLQYHAGKPVPKDIQDLLKNIEDGRE